MTGRARHEPPKPPTEIDGTKVFLGAIVDDALERPGQWQLVFPEDEDDHRAWEWNRVTGRVREL